MHPAKSNLARQMYSISMEILLSLLKIMNVRTIFDPYHNHCTYILCNNLYYMQFSQPVSEGLLSTNPTPNILSIQVHLDGVYLLLSNIQQHIASRPDNLPVRFLQEVAYEISPVLSVIFQASLDQGVLLSI